MNEGPHESDFRVEEHLDALRDPAVVGGGAELELIQTHISVVLLCGERVFKLKKALHLPFLDYSTPALRERACRDELRLNRRLCDDVYLDVVALRRTPMGLRLGAAPPAGGEVVDHAVVMRRLPADRMLDVLVEKGTVRAAELDALARQVASFHARQAAAADERVRAAGAPEHVLAFARANFDETRPRCGAVFDAELHALLRQRLDAALPPLAERLASRARGGRVVDGHGDLHSRNVCMTSPPTIYDCIEFHADFRCGDVATEIAFLAMDLRFRGHPELATRFVDTYVAATGDEDLRAVLPELIRYRAMVRAKVDAIAASEPSIPRPERERMLRSARRHLRLCAWTIAEESGTFALVASGLPASGKSFVFDAIRSETGWPVIATDRVRKELCGVAATERLPPSAYDQATSARVYDEIVTRALAIPGPVLVDGNFATRALRDQARTALSRPSLLVQFDVPREIAHARLRARSRDAAAISDADVRVYETLRASFQPCDPATEAPVLAVDGAAELDAQLDRVACAVLRATCA